jgi:hypothetical protein
VLSEVKERERQQLAAKAKNLQQRIQAAKPTTKKSIKLKIDQFIYACTKPETQMQRKQAIDNALLGKPVEGLLGSKVEEIIKWVEDQLRHDG